MSKLSKKLTTLVTVFALLSTQVQSVSALYVSGTSSQPGQVTSQQVYDAKWRLQGNQTPFPGNTVQPNNKTPFPTNPVQPGNQTAFPTEPVFEDGNKSPFPNDINFNTGNKTPLPNDMNFDTGNKTPLPNDINFDTGNKTPFPNRISFDQGNKVPYPSDPQFDDGNKTPFPSNPEQPDNKTPFPSTPERPDNKTPFPSTPERPDNKTPFPSTPERPDNKTPFPSTPEQPDNKTPFPTEPEQMNPGYYYCQEVDTDDIIFVKILSGNDTNTIYFYSKNGELLEVKEINETASMPQLIEYVRTRVYNCQSISKELFNLYVFRSPPEDDEDVKVPVCVATFNHAPNIYTLNWVYPEDLEDYYREKNIIGIWDFNQDGEIDTDDCRDFDRDRKEDRPPRRTDDISGCEYRPYPRDIDGHWGEIYIRRLFDLCIVEGYENGYFRPNQNVTRAELVKMGLFANGIEPNRGCYDRDCGSPFMDLDDWQGRWVRTAWDRGIVDGYGNSQFRPNQAITRAEAVKIVLATYGYSPLNVENSFFNDVDGWSKGWIEKAHELGIVQGIGNGNFDPNRYITRAEAAKIIAKMIEHWDTSVRSDNRGRDDYDYNGYYYDDRGYYCDEDQNRYDKQGNVIGYCYNY